MPTKQYTVEFYTGVVGADGQGGNVSQMLLELANSGEYPTLNIKGMVHEIRELRLHHGGATFSGVFAKFREDDLPHAGSPGGDERELGLDDGEGLIEKNHFLYHSNRELLIFQRNGNGSTTSRLGAYFSDIAGETTIFNPVLQAEPTRRLMRNELLPRSLTLSFTKPSNPEMYPDDIWSNRLFSILNDAGGVRMHTRISSDARSTDEEKRYLSNRIKAAACELIDIDGVSVAKLDVEDEDGMNHPIDLIADRLLSSQEVEMDGRYPVTEAIYAALRRAKDECAAELQEIFGGQGNAVA